VELTGLENVEFVGGALGAPKGIFQGVSKVRNLIPITSDIIFSPLNCFGKFFLKALEPHVNMLTRAEKLIPAIHLPGLP